ncbi:MAG: RNA polymerase sigma factor RpoD/SigA [Treponema sp.]|jgi:RNA polymerase primary sigma factor|nr:RNA polymerase sigma factor RpoD/SigA [Treponema sp.]
MRSAARTSCRKSEGEELLRIYFDQIKLYPLLEFSEEIELSRLAQKGSKDALHKLVQGNLRFVVKIARQYAVQDVPFIDLIQEGNLGLIHAAEKYDHKKNVRFCTYATWWIRQFITRFLTNKRRIVRLPHRKEEILRRIQHTYHVLSQTLMHQPRAEDIAGELGIPVKDVNFIISMTSGPLPLEMSRSGQEDSGAAMDVHEDYTYSPERTLFRNHYREGARRFLDRLKDRERQVLSYRYQLEGTEPHTLKEIGDKMDLSPETVRQIEMKALAKIRSHAEELEQFGSLEAV